MTDLSTFQPKPIIRRLEVFPAVVDGLTRGVAIDDRRWKPSERDWSITEVLAHLALEESQDFRPRLEAIAAQPQFDWQPIDPEQAVRANDAHAKGADHWLALFTRERQKSIAWLDSLATTVWSRARVHPVHGRFSAAELLGAWSAHDALHLRQLAKRLHQIAQRDVGEHAVLYAGEWTERPVS